MQRARVLGVVQSESCKLAEISMEMAGVAVRLILLLFLVNCCRTEHLEKPPSSPQCMEDHGSGIIICEGVAGHSLTIPCGNHSQNTSGVEFTYSRQFPNSIFMPIADQTRFLELNVTIADHHSLVRCRTNTSITEYYYRLNITYKPRQIGLTREPVVTAGQSLLLSCPIDANPPALYNWTAFENIDEFRQQDLPASLVYLSEDRRSWSVGMWSTEYNGFYVCCASNELGETCFRDPINYFLSVDICETTATPVGTISVLGNQTEYPLGSTVTLECRFNNLARFEQPQSWFYWTNGGYQIVFGGRNGYKEIIRHDDNTCTWISQLTITDLTRQNAGLYSCERNTIAVQTMVTLEACSINMKEDFQIQPFNSSVHLDGSLVTVTCLVERVDRSHPPQWCRNNGTVCIEVQNIEGVFQNLTTFDADNCKWISQLEIPLFSGSTQGEYSCFIPGTNHSQNITLGLQGSVNVAAVSAGSVVSVLAVIAVVSVIGLVLITIRCSKLSYTRLKEPPMKGFKWDVFLSYHTEAEEFVLTHVKMPLEAHQPAYNICWHHVDFLAGRTILDNINEAVDKSRKIVFVFSRDFSKSEYCMAELARALDRLQHTQTSCIVPIVLDQDGVPSQLKSKVTYWPVVRPDGDFTKKLVSYLGPPITSATPKSCTVQM